ncbi:hypothetical protein RRG08_032202 [Elysia crispata]|uniref:Uncharacterized protein n=1 Tax=Elysia crispata TaxID=231223 RepID=A0AAE1ABD2_9GAST|nr:hypothetical protein RRG08_032202 [Elysia crispata]
MNALSAHVRAEDPRPVCVINILRGIRVKIGDVFNGAEPGRDRRLEAAQKWTLASELMDSRSIPIVGHTIHLSVGGNETVEVTIFGSEVAQTTTLDLDLAVHLDRKSSGETFSADRDNTKDK